MKTIPRAFRRVSVPMLAVATVFSCCATRGSAADSDTLKIKDDSGALVVNFSSTEGGVEFFSALQIGVSPQNIKAGTIFFTGANEPSDSILTALKMIRRSMSAPKSIATP